MCIGDSRGRAGLGLNLALGRAEGRGAVEGLEALWAGRQNGSARAGRGRAGRGLDLALGRTRILYTSDAAEEVESGVLGGRRLLIE